jgi:predicted transposase YbfD/YdcC
VLSTEYTGLKVKGIKQVACLHRTRELLKQEKVEEETVFLITNIEQDKLDAKSFMELKREYWSIENKLHYRKDLVFNEDRSTIRAKHGPENMSNLRNFAIGFLMSNKVKNVKRCVDNIKYRNPADFHDFLFGYKIAA